MHGVRPGLKAAIPTLLGDALKGVAAVLLMRYVAGAFFPDMDAIAVAAAAALAGAGAVVGHNWSLYLGFKGGAGGITDRGHDRGDLTAHWRDRLPGRAFVDLVEPHGLDWHLQRQRDFAGVRARLYHCRSDSLAVCSFWPDCLRWRSHSLSAAIARRSKMGRSG